VDHDAPSAGPASPAALYAATAHAFAALVAAIAPDAWDQPGLGEWTVKDLVGHAGRALTTVEDYLAAPPVDGPPCPTPSPISALHAASIRPPSPSGGGRRPALGDDPAAAVAATVARVLAAVEAARRMPPSRWPAAPWPWPTTCRPGSSSCRSIPWTSPGRPDGGADRAGARHLGLGGPGRADRRRRGDAAEVLLALTGRRSLPTGTSVI